MEHAFRSLNSSGPPGGFLPSFRVAPNRLQEGLWGTGPVDSVSLGRPGPGGLARKAGTEPWSQFQLNLAASTESGLSVMAQNLATLTWDWLTRAFPESKDSEDLLFEAMLEALRVFSPHSMSHSDRVADLVADLAGELELSQDEQEALCNAAFLREAGMLGVHLGRMEEPERQRLADHIRCQGVSLHEAGRIHDVGKLQVPPTILTKPGPLDEEEKAVMRLHPLIGEMMLRRFEDLAPALPAVRGHHERWDGGGYPDGHWGDNIALSARLLCLADSFDAMTGPRPYREQATVPEALHEILRNSGTQFDPDLAAVFVRMVARQQADAEVRPDP